MEQGQAQHGQGRDQRRNEAAAQKRRIWEHPGLTRANIGQELDRFAARHGLTFAPGVKKTLAESCPWPPWPCRANSKEILLLAGDAKTIQPGHLGALDALDPFDLFSFLRSLQSRAGAQAWDRLMNDPAMASSDVVFPVSSLMLREARMLWHLLHGEEAQSPATQPQGRKGGPGQEAGGRPHQPLPGIWSSKPTRTSRPGGSNEPRSPRRTSSRTRQRLW
ncbi:hypothetical protein MASR2M17_23470 [Aminivibrio sp.]